MKWKQMGAIVLAALLMICSAGCTNETKQGDLSYDTLGALLSESRETVEKSLGIDLDTDASMGEAATQQGNRKSAYTLNETFSYEGRECKVELDFLNDGLYRFRYVFDNAQDGGNFKAAHQLTMDIYSKMKQNYGEPDAAMQGLDSWLGKAENFESCDWNTLLGAGYQDQWTLDNTQEIREKLQYTSSNEQIYAQLGFRCWPVDEAAMNAKEDRGTAYVSVGYRSASDLHM